MPQIPESDQNPEQDDNPFRANSARNVLARARERLQLVRHWLIRHEGPEAERQAAQDRVPRSNGKDTE